MPSAAPRVRIVGRRRTGVCIRLPSRHSCTISAANALAFKSSPVACCVKLFQSSERPGAKTRVLRNSPTALLPTKFALDGINSVQHVARDRVQDLVGEELAHQVIVIVRRRAHDVDLAGIVGRVAALAAGAPSGTARRGPTRACSGPGRGCRRAAFSNRNITWHQREKTSSLARCILAPALSKAAGSATATPIACEPVGVLREPLEQHGDAFGRQDVRLGSQHVRERGRDVLAAVDRVAQLVEHRAHPVLVGHDVGQHAARLPCGRCRCRRHAGSCRAFRRGRCGRSRRRSAGRCRHRTRGKA